MRQRNDVGFLSSPIHIIIYWSKENRVKVNKNNLSCKTYFLHSDFQLQSKKIKVQNCLGLSRRFKILHNKYLEKGKFLGKNCCERRFKGNLTIFLERTCTQLLYIIFCFLEIFLIRSFSTAIYSTVTFLLYNKDKDSIFLKTEYSCIFQKNKFV